MGTKLTYGQIDDLGAVALAALRYITTKDNYEGSVAVCGAIAHLAPLMSDTNIRQLQYEVDCALKRPGNDRHELVELMIILRRVDRP